MDDASWEFLCNNSPKLVKKYRSKTPSFIFAVTAEDDLSQLNPASQSKLKHLKQPSNLRKNSFKTIYRNPTPSKSGISEINKVMIKPSKIFKSPDIADFMRRHISPVRNAKRTASGIKKAVPSLLKKFG